MKTFALLMLGVALPAAAGTCTAPAEGRMPRIVELYTSEGCNSCPPADRWLSSLKAEPDVVALAFHVDYWDRLGWKDRFASPAFTRRQAEQRAINGARFSYTPQVVIDGIDGRRALPAAAVGEVSLALERDGDRYVARVRTPSPRRLAGYWAVTEDDHRSDVKAGENEGVTLRHDFVVREFVPVAAWNATASASTTMDFKPAGSADPAHPRAVNFVIVDAATGRPVAARRLGC